MWQECCQQIYKLDMTTRGVYWSRRRFTGCIASCWKLVCSRGLGERERTEGLFEWSPKRRRTESPGHVLPLFFSLFVLIRLCAAALSHSPSVCDTPVFVFPLTPSLFTEATVFSRGFLSLLRWPLQALQWFLCQPHQGPEGPGERYDTRLHTHEEYICGMITCLLYNGRLRSSR